MIKVSPTVAEIDELRRNAPDGAIVMINLLKFKPDGGREAYDRYMRTSGPGAIGAGVELIYAGKAGKDIAGDVAWDLVLIARYPSFECFADFVSHPDYQNLAAPLRTEALERALFMITEPLDWTTKPD